LAERGYKTRLDLHRLWVPLACFGDGLCIWLAFGAGYWLRSLRPHQLLPWDVYAALGLLTALSYWGIQAGLGGYGESKRLSRFEEWASLLVGLGLTFGLVLAGAFFVRSVSLSRLVVGYAGLLALLSLTLVRVGLRLGMGWLCSRGYGRRQVIWVGSWSVLAEVLERLQRSPQLGFQVVAWAGVEQGSFEEDPPSQNGDPCQDSYPVLNTARPTSDGVKSADRTLSGSSRGTLSCLCSQLEPSWSALERLDLVHLIAYLQAHPEVQEVWFGQPELATAPLLLSLQTLSVQVRLVPDILSFLTVNFSLQSLDGIPLLTLRQPPLRYAHNRFLKRAVDILGASLGLILLSPLFLIIALLVACSSPGPILYWQERVSLDGRRFWIAKFRTMRVDAEGSDRPGWTRPGDPRRTKIGAFLRRTNLDELPQLWNVLKGEMSLVGPRPERPYFVEQFSQEIPKYPDRHLVKSGLTGWAQIHGLRGDTSIARRTQYDLYYVQNWSLWLDLRILAITFWQGIRGRLAGY
jgi:putative colanic acid biosynthesis UDP-glucose lipid carrier transferase